MVGGGESGTTRDLSNGRGAPSHRQECPCHQRTGTGVGGREAHAGLHRAHHTQPHATSQPPPPGPPACRSRETAGRGVPGPHAELEDTRRCDQSPLSPLRQKRYLLKMQKRKLNTSPYVAMGLCGLDLQEVAEEPGALAESLLCVRESARPSVRMCMCTRMCVRM